MTICSQYGSLDNHTVLLGKSYTSAPHVKLQKERKYLKNQYNSGSALSPTLTCGPAPQVHNTYVLVHSVCKGAGAYSCKSQKTQVSLQKTYLWSILEHSRRWFDMD